MPNDCHNQQLSIIVLCGKLLTMMTLKFKEGVVVIFEYGAGGQSFVVTVYNDEIYITVCLKMLLLSNFLDPRLKDN